MTMAFGGRGRTAQSWKTLAVDLNEWVMNSLMLELGYGDLGGDRISHVGIRKEIRKFMIRDRNQTITSHGTLSCFVTRRQSSFDTVCRYLNLPNFLLTENILYSPLNELYVPS